LRSKGASDEHDEARFKKKAKNNFIYLIVIFSIGSIITVITSYYK
ncbi:MAG: hypothetical protein K0R90_1429, partial [Oscillospiraceae bacterium]|jgi:hypothetical protein|nr:hypothetical protein [Oscillospiraceae bacterium]